MHDHANSSSNGLGKFLLLGVLVAGAYLWYNGHQQHILNALPFLFLLACPLMHLFGHGGHGGHQPQQNANDKPGDSSPHAH